MSKDFASYIIKTLRQQGFQAYLAGGCVRDLLLKREAADYDVATNATPEQVMEVFPETYAVGAQFGVVLVPPGESQTNTRPVEVATFRSDLGYSGELWVITVAPKSSIRFSSAAKSTIDSQPVIWSATSFPMPSILRS